MKRQPPHPRDALYGGEPPPMPLAACDHYAGSTRFIQKAFALQAEHGGAFDVTCDLEDGAAVGQERTWLREVVALVQARPSHPGSVGVRIHPATGALWKEEIALLVDQLDGRLSHLTLPKVESVADVRRVIRHLRIQKSRRPLPKLHVILESLSGIDDAVAIAQLPEVQSLEFGIMDFVSSLHGAIPAGSMQSPGQFRHALLRSAKVALVGAALRAGKVASHNVTIRFADTAQTFHDAFVARTEFGFMRMWSIHPDQITPILQAMAPSGEELAHAVRVLCIGQDAAWGPVRVDHELYDRASYRYFWSLLQRAERCQQKLPPEARARFFEGC